LFIFFIECLFLHLFEYKRQKTEVFLFLGFFAVQILSEKEITRKVAYESVAHSLIAPKMVGAYYDPVKKKRVVKV
jgi:asparagine N-glycosylation enzyme membrane subunit Stt3